MSSQGAAGGDQHLLAPLEPGVLQETKGPTRGRPQPQLPRPPGRRASARSPLLRPSPAHLLRLVYKVIGLVPVGQEVCGLLVIHPDVMVCKQAREKIVYFSSDI